MSSAMIVFEDEGGQIACKATFSSIAGGFDKASHAHQHATLVLRMMDELCTKTEAQPPVEPALIVQA